MENLGLGEEKEGAFQGEDVALVQRIEGDRGSGNGEMLCFGGGGREEILLLLLQCPSRVLVRTQEVRSSGQGL